MTPDERKRFITTHYPFARADDLAAHLGMKVETLRLIAHRMGVCHVGGQLLDIGGILCKRCSTCEVTKQLDDFYADNNHPSGVTSRCIRCTIIHTKHKCPTCGQSIDKKNPAVAGR